MPKNNKTLGIVPARYASSRFPGKPLVEIAGKSMVQLVWEQVNKSSRIDAAVVATDDERVYDHVISFGGQAVMTAAHHASGTDRCAEVAKMDKFSNFGLVVNIQGDEPFIHPAQIDLAVDLLVTNERFSISTLAVQITGEEELFDPNVVKTVFGLDGKALYFSRSAIPCFRNVEKGEWLSRGQFFKHPGLYAFRREALFKAAALPQSRLEMVESLEQLRWLENGIDIGVALTEKDTFSIDTPEDLARLALKAG